MTQEQDQEVQWDDLPEVLQARILAYTSDEWRCNVIPTVSKAMRAVHRGYPPQRTTFVIDRFITRPMLWWGAQIAPHLERLDFIGVAGGQDPPNLLPQLLHTLAEKAPRLSRVGLNLFGRPAEGAVFDSLGFCSQVTELRLEGWVWEGSGRQMWALGGLSNLKVLMLRDIDVRQATPNQATALWRTLATMPSLRQLGLRLVHGGTELPFFLSAISKMQQLRTLSLGGVETCSDVEDTFHPSLQLLSGLELLSVASPLPSSVLIPTASMEGLQLLNLRIEEGGLPPSALHFDSTYLSSLMLRGGAFTAADQILAPGCNALPHLLDLTLVDMGLQEFPDSIAARLEQLTYLHLGGNALTRLPSVLTNVLTLKELSVSRNESLELSEGDGEALLSLPRLHTVSLAKFPGQPLETGFSADSLLVLATLEAAAPGLVEEVLM